MMRDPTVLRNDWMNLRARPGGLHALDIADRLGVSECALVASACSATGDVSATRLRAHWPSFVSQLPKLGTVKTVTRNRFAVIEVTGTYDAVEFFGAMGQSVSSVDLRIFAARWKHAFAVREVTARGVSRGLQFFDEAGQAIHKVYLRDASDAAFYDALLREHAADDQSQTQRIDPAIPAPAAIPDAAVDVAGFRAAWRAMTDTHQFHALLRLFRLTRIQALRLAGSDLAYPVACSAPGSLLRAAADDDVPIMVFVGNPGVIQIHSGRVKKVVVHGGWINVLDPEFNLHLRKDEIASAWVVRKPTADGDVTAVETFARDGEPIALFVGARKPGAKESDAWRRIVATLAPTVP
jgi:putative hemin transport protein